MEYVIIKLVLIYSVLLCLEKELLVTESKLMFRLPPLPEFAGSRSRPYNSVIESGLQNVLVQPDDLLPVVVKNIESLYTMLNRSSTIKM